MSEKLFAGFITIIIIGILLVWIFRFLVEIGIFPLSGRIARWCYADRKSCEECTGSPITRKEIIDVFLQAFGIRVVVYIVGIVICMLLTNEYSTQRNFSFVDFLDSWNRWDSPHYIDLAKSGYKACIEDGKHLFLVFFPLYPWLLRVIYLFVRNWELAGLALSTVSFCIGSVFFYATVKEEFGRLIAKRSVWLISLYPFAFFYGGIMTESLFFCLLAAGFFCIKRHKWCVAGILGIFCSLCRVQGILLLGVGMVEFLVTYPIGTLIKQHKGKRFVKAFFTKAIWLFLMPIGNVIYFVINYVVEGDFFRFRVYQEKHWYHTTTWVSNCLTEILQYALGQNEVNRTRMSIWIPELVLFVVAIVVIIYALRRHPIKYTAFLIVYTAVNYSVTFLISGGRYMACALPMFVILAEWTRRKPKIYYIIILLSVLLFGAYFAGYMTGQQIM